MEGGLVMVKTKREGIIDVVEMMLSTTELTKVM